MSKNQLASEMRPRPVKNLKEYLRIKEIRDATGLIDGKIFYNGEFWSEEVYEETFPKTEIEYDNLRIVTGKQIGRAHV